MDPTALTPLDGGWSGETFVAEVAGERSVVRIYAGPSHRGDNAHDVDAALLRLVRGLVPVPEVLEVRRADPATDMPALLVTSFLPGVRADLLLPDLDDERLAVLGARLGRILADLAGMPMLRAGPFVDGDLTIGSFALDGQTIDGLPAFVAGHEEALSHWAPGELEGLREVAVDAQALLDTVGRFCLVHSDVNPKNLLVDPDTLEVTGLLDWEFAHAGHPYTDLGNLLRFDREPAFVEAVLDAYVARHGGAPGEALDLARAADLWALVDLAARRGQNPVADRAHDLLLAISRTRDVHVAPAGGRGASERASNRPWHRSPGFAARVTGFSGSSLRSGSVRVDLLNLRRSSRGSRAHPAAAPQPSALIAGFASAPSGASVGRGESPRRTLVDCAWSLPASRTERTPSSLSVRSSSGHHHR